MHAMSLMNHPEAPKYRPNIGELRGDRILALLYDLPSTSRSGLSPGLPMEAPNLSIGDDVGKAGVSCSARQFRQLSSELVIMHN